MVLREAQAYVEYTSFSLEYSPLQPARAWIGRHYSVIVKIADPLPRDTNHAEHQNIWTRAGSKGAHNLHEEVRSMKRQLLTLAATLSLAGCAMGGGYAGAEYVYAEPVE